MAQGSPRWLIFLIFMQLLEIFGQIPGWFPLGVSAPVWEILDPPLYCGLWGPACLLWTMQHTVLTAAVDVTFLDSKFAVSHGHDLGDGRQVDVCHSEAPTEPVENWNTEIYRDKRKKEIPPSFSKWSPPFLIGSTWQSQWCTSLYNSGHCLSHNYYRKFCSWKDGVVVLM